LAQAEEQNHETVAKVWYLWRHSFLPAKQLEVKLRRELANDELDESFDDPVNIEGTAAAPPDDIEAAQP
jgi:hypothetical protein